MAASIITTVRIVLSFALIWCPAYSHLFYWMYLAAGATDVIDGTVAQVFSDPGMRLGNSCSYTGRVLHSSRKRGIKKVYDRSTGKTF